MKFGLTSFYDQIRSCMIRWVHSESQEQSFFFIWINLKTQDFKVGNVRRSVFYGQIPKVGISLKAQTERINGLLEGYLSHFSANQKDWSCWMLLSAMKKQIKMKKQITLSKFLKEVYFVDRCQWTKKSNHRKQVELLRSHLLLQT